MNPIFKKLNYKDQKQIYIIHAPDSFKKDMDEMKHVTSIKTSLTGAKSIEFFMAFVIKQKELDDLIKKMKSLMIDDGVVWFVYPKGTSKKYTCEFNRDTGWTELGKAGYEPVRAVAIDEDWSGLRFRNPTHIKKMTRSFAMTEVGKKKVAAAKKK
jgi:hypothetical protein